MRRSGSIHHPHSEHTKRRTKVSGFLCSLAVIAVSLFPATGAAADHRRPSPPPAVTAEGLRVLPAVAPVMNCSDVPRLDLRRAAGAEVTIASAVVVSENTPNPYCEVRGTIAPANTIVVRLPLEGWTQRYLQTGCGGLCGNANINYGQAAECPVVEDGTIASATTDMGHQGQNDGSWAAGNPQAQIDFAYRGVHVTALTAKALIAKFYGRSPAYSYFTGCSDGGREALMEAQRFPDDFDGIAAGAPANNLAVQNTYHHAWNVLANKDAAGNDILLAGKLPLIHNAVLAACDELDGLADGVLDDPRACAFDPASLLCTAGQDPAACLSAAEADVVRKLHEGAVDDRGRRLEPEISHEWGSELAWTLFVPEAPGDPVSSEQFALSYLRYLADPNNPRPDFQLTDLEFTKQAFWETMQSSSYMSAMDPDLGAFKRSGGKLLMWHGWNDHHISPQSTLAYYDAVRRTMGKHPANDFTRLFMFPGVEHCSGGEGPDSFDVLTPVMAWVESGRAPASITASKIETADDGTETVSRTRPVYPYPAVARYDGSGSTDDAANFVSHTPRREIAPGYEWVGSRLYSSDYQTWCRAEGAELVCQPHRGGHNWLSRETGRH